MCFVHMQEFVLHVHNIHMYICIYHFINFFHRHVKSVVMGGRMEEILISRVILTKTYCEGVIV